MRLFRRPVNRATGLIGQAASFIPARANNNVMPVVGSDQALTHGAVWACLRLRANIVSSMPVRVFRDIDTIPVAQTLPPFLVTPGGDLMESVTGAPNVGINEWLYSTQFDLDRYGNCFGVVTARNSLGYPARVELVAADDVTIVGSGQRILSYRIGQVEYRALDVWHERQYTTPGIPVGMSPLTFAGLSSASYLAAQKFANDFFATGGAPAMALKNTEADKVSQQDMNDAKSAFRAATANRDLFVHGADWELSAVDLGTMNDGFIKQMEWGVADICRFYDVPASLIGAPSGQNVTYANVSQQNLELLTLHIAPAVRRREVALTAALPAEYYVSFDKDSLLAMDPQQLSLHLINKVKGRTMTPNEARALEGRAPFTDAQIKEFEYTTFYSSSTSESTSSSIAKAGN